MGPSTDHPRHGSVPRPLPRYQPRHRARYGGPLQRVGGEPGNSREIVIGSGGLARTAYRLRFASLSRTLTDTRKRPRSIEADHHFTVSGFGNLVWTNLRLARDLSPRVFRPKTHCADCTNRKVCKRVGFAPFAAPSWNARYLREADGWGRRIRRQRAGTPARNSKR
jgi:hypothetical protein